MAKAEYWVAMLTDLVDPAAFVLLVAANATPVIASRLFGKRFDAACAGRVLFTVLDVATARWRKSSP